MPASGSAHFALRALTYPRRAAAEARSAVPLLSKSRVVRVDP